VNKNFTTKENNDISIEHSTKSHFNSEENYTYSTPEKFDPQKVKLKQQISSI